MGVHKATKADILVQSELAITEERAREAFPWLADEFLGDAVTLLVKARKDRKANKNDEYREGMAAAALGGHNVATYWPG